MTTMNKQHDQFSITRDRVLLHLFAKFLTSLTDIDAGTTKHSGKLQQTQCIHPPCTDCR